MALQTAQLKPRVFSWRYNYKWPWIILICSVILVYVAPPAQGHFLLHCIRFCYQVRRGVAFPKFINIVLFFLFLFLRFVLLHAYSMTLPVTHVLYPRTSDNTQAISGGTEINPVECHLTCLLVHIRNRALPKQGCNNSLVKFTSTYFITTLILAHS